MIKRYKYLFFLVLVAVVFTGCLDGGGGSPGYGGIVGTVMYQDTGQPVVNAEVRMAGRSRYTNTNGQFTFENVRPDTYLLTILHSSILGGQWKDSVTIPSNGKVQDFFVPREPVNVRGKGYYVVVGVDKYPEDIKALPGPRDDAMAVYNELFWNNKLPAIGVLLVRNGGRNALEPTKENIESSIREAVKEARRSPVNTEDYLVIYFSGRTGYDFLRPSDDVRGEKWITDAELEGWVSDFPGHVTLIVDGSNSESMADGIPLEPLALREMRYTVLASAKKGDDAWHDAYLGNGKLSVFTHFLVDGLTTRRADRKQPYGDISVRELYEYVDAEMLKYNPIRQVPHIHEGYWGDTVIFRY